ncbi:MAG: Glu-tRNA(Gln) amidotransferase GatDE subunit E [Nitrosopumilus sp. B06]|nr:MAG: Glu-tRNA(Gln) amidotransferase GatDE subunit E [Nitrosopumilus sp. B06]
MGVLTMNLGVLVGLEVHQQLATDSKLFCSCKQAESEEYFARFQRKLRASKGELGETDPAALFENAKSKTMMYYANPQSSCLVERDEEPPHELDRKARSTALVIALALGSSVFDEIYPMRKTVVDGSNTTGFQRTMLVSRGGSYSVDGKKIGIQSICLEEDAAKILGEDADVKKYGLGRLGVPLVEIATDPFEAEPGEIKKIALSLGRILRSTKMVRRGLGTIRQDVNVSIKGGGVVIEVKGVQQLDQLEKVVEYEAKRQHGLLQISKELQKRKWSHDPGDIKNVTELFSKSESKIVINAVKRGHGIHAIPFRDMAGMFGYSPYEGVRLGRDVAELVRIFGLGGVFHSDELPNYGIKEHDISNLRESLGINSSDGFLILAGPDEQMPAIVRQIVSRIEHIRDKGIPADTRLAVQSGETKFLRPRPGAARMYPETDVPPVIVTQDELEVAQKNIPKSWDESLAELQEKHSLNMQLAVQIFDSRYAEIFEKITSMGANPTFAASVLCSTITNLERSGLNPNLLRDEEILKTFEFLKEKKIAKESVEIIFGAIMGGKADTVEDAINSASISTVDEDDLNKVIEGIVEKNMELVRNQKERAVGPLMGIVMKELRGRASGEVVNRILSESIKKRL